MAASAMTATLMARARKRLVHTRRRERRAIAIAAGSWSISTWSTALAASTILERAKCGSLADVRKLTLYGLGLRDVSAVSACANLSVLSLVGNHVATLAPFAPLTSLTELFLRRNDVADAAELAHLRPLRLLHTLWLQDNPIDTVDGITSLRNLQVLSLAGTQVRSLEQLAPLVKVAGLFDLSFVDGYYSAAPIVDAPVVDPPADASSFIFTVNGRGRSQRFCSSSTAVSWSGRQ